MVHAERAALLDDLWDLDAVRWEEPSLCGEWTVHDVVTHLVDTARTTRLGFVVGLARAGFDFDRQNARGVERHRGASPAAVSDATRAVRCPRRQHSTQRTGASLARTAPMQLTGCPRKTRPSSRSEEGRLPDQEPTL